MSKNRPGRKHKRIVRAAQPQPEERTPPDALSALPGQPVPPKRRPREQTATKSGPSLLRDYRGLLVGIAVAFVTLLALLMASSQPQSDAPVAGQPLAPSSQSSDAAFAGIDQNDLQALMRRGKELYDQGQFEDAAKVYQRAIAVKPDNQAAHSNLGSVYFRLQRLDEALSAFREAVRLNPNDAEARQNLGAGLAALGSFDAAIVEYLQAVSLKPDLAPARYSLGVLYQETNEKDKAIQELKRYLELGQDGQLRADAERRLQSLGAK